MYFETKETANRNYCLPKLQVSHCKDEGHKIVSISERWTDCNKEIGQTNIDPGELAR